MLVLIATLLVSSAGLGNPAAAAVRPVAARSLTTADVLVRSLDDFRGAIVLTPSGKETQILEITWGLDKDSVLFPAYLKVMDDAGDIATNDSRHLASTLITSLDQLHGFYLPWKDRPRIWVEDIQFGVFPGGRLSIVGSRSRGAQGEVIDSIASMQKTVHVCTSVGVWGCGDTSGCSIHTATCSNPPACPCTPGTHSCPASTTWQCIDNPWCPPGQVCTLDANGTTCSCKNP